MKLHLNNIRDLRTACEDLEKRHYKKTKGPVFAGGKTYKLLFEKDIRDNKKRFLYGIKAFLATFFTLGGALASSKIRDYWDHAFTGKKIKKIKFPEELERRIRKILNKELVPKKDPVVKTTTEEVIGNFQRETSFNSIIGQKISDQEAEIIAECILKTAQTKILDITDNEASEEGWKAILQAIEKNNSLDYLLFEKVQSGAVVQGLTAVMTHNRSIENMTVHFGDIDIVELKAFLQALKTNPVLKKVQLEFKELSDEAVKALTETLKENQILSGVDLKCPNLSAENYNKLLMAAENHPSLKSLLLEHPPLDQRNLEDLKARIENNSVLQSLTLDEEELLFLAPALAKNNQIKELSIRSGSEAAIKALVKILEDNNSIESIFFPQNSIDDEKLSLLAPVLKKNKSLKNIHLDNQNIGDKGASAFAEALSQNESIHSLNLSNNHIGPAGAMAIADMLEKNKTIAFVDLEKNHLKDEGAIPLLNALKNNPKVMILKLAENELGDQTLMASTGLLKENSTLHSLKLERNRITQKGATAFANFVAKENIPKSAIHGIRLVHLKENPIDDEGLVALDALYHYRTQPSNVSVYYD